MTPPLLPEWDNYMCRTELSWEPANLHGGRSIIMRAAETDNRFLLDGKISLNGYLCTIDR